MFVPVYILTLVVSTLSDDLNDVDKVVGRDFNWDFLKKIFQFHLYVNPHPVCALEDELCTLDNNCCRELECKMFVDKGGIKYTCQQSGSGESTIEGDQTDSDVQWNLDTSSSEESLKEVYRSRLEDARRQEDKLMTDTYHTIKELEKPLTLVEMRDLKMEKELNDLKRKKELKELREWIKNREHEEEAENEKKAALKEIAKHRVKKVLNEEERQKQELFKDIKEEMKKYKQIADKIHKNELL